MKTRARCAALLLFAFILVGCDAEPPEGAPRAPLPSEIKPYVGPAVDTKPRSVGEIWKEFEAKKAKEKAAEDAAASKDAPPGPAAAESPATPDPKSAEPKSDAPKDASPPPVATPKP
jgi:hypothetical protein